MTEDPEAPTGWSAGGVRLLAGLLVAFQLVQGLADPIPLGNRRFTESYYLVTYRHGFIRRGLLGEGLRLMFGRPTRVEVDLTADLVAVLAVGAVVVLIELLIRHGTSSSWAMALLLAASPFTIDFFLTDRRPDLPALALLVILGLVLTRAQRGLVPGLVAIGLGFAALVLVHEDVVLIEVPWALVLVATATAATAAGTRASRAGEDGRRRHRAVGLRLAIVAVPPVVAAMAVLAHGLPSARRVHALQADGSALHLTGNTVFTYLPDSIRTSVDLVGAIPPTAMARTLVLGAVLVGLQLAWVRRWVRPRLARTVTAGGRRLLGLALGSVILATTAVLFATGFDWVRWFADCGAAWLIVQAFATLLPDAPGAWDVVPVPGGDGRAARPSLAPVTPVPPRIHLSRWLPGLAVYLVAVPPLDVLFVTDQLRHFLVFV